MPMKNLRWLAIAVLAASCATRQPLVRSSAELGCKISPEKAQELSNSACQSAVTAGVTMCSPPVSAIAGVMVCESAANGAAMGAMSIDSASIERNGTATQNVSAPIVMPNGEVAAVAACSISRRHHSVVYAVLTSGPTTKAEANYLRSLDACAD
jgi:hypothetical protein